MCYFDINDESTYHDDPRLPKHVNTGVKCITSIINDDRNFYCPYHPMGLLLPKTREKKVRSVLL